MSKISLKFPPNPVQLNTHYIENKCVSIFFVCICVFLRHAIVCVCFCAPLLFLCILCLYVFMYLCLYISTQVSVKKKPFDSMSICIFCCIICRDMTFVIRWSPLSCRFGKKGVGCFEEPQRYSKKTDNVNSRKISLIPWSLRTKRVTVSRKTFSTTKSYKSLITSLPSPSFIKRQIYIRRQIKCCIVACILYILHAFMHLSQWVSGENLDLNLI